MKDRYKMMHKDDIAAVFTIDCDTKAVLSLDIIEETLMLPRAARVKTRASVRLVIFRSI